MDMVVNERLYLSVCDRMNDPREGGFSVVEQSEIIKSGNQKDIETLCKLKIKIDGTRFVSFSGRIDNHLLWAHYAGEFARIAFKYEFPNTSDIIEICQIRYGDQPRIDLKTAEDLIKDNVGVYTQGMLLSKSNAWSYEDEYRLFLKNSDSSYLSKIKPKAIILGGRGHRYDDVFTQICRKYEIIIGYLLPKNGDLLEVFFPDEKKSPN